MGFLRRRTILIILILFFVSIQLYSVYQRDEAPNNIFSRAVLAITYYPQKAVSVSSGKVVSVWNSYLDLVELKDENLTLREEIKRLRQERFELGEARLQNKRLKMLLDFKDSSPDPVVTASVIGASPSILRSQVVVVDRGMDSGISQGMPVASFEGIVGRILLSGDKSSEVLLITDPVSAVDAYIHRTRARGIVKGTGSGTVMQYIEKKSDVSIGDKIISSGKDGFFPKGVVIGTVTQIQPDGSFMSASVSPEVDLNSLEEVVIILKNVGSVVLNE